MEYTYTVVTHTKQGPKEVTHRGFTRLSYDNRQTQHPATLMVIAWFDGEPDMWLVDGEDGIKALREYYKADWGDRDIPFDVWSLHRIGHPYVGDIV